MVDIVLVFEVHQPHRLKRSLFWENKILKHVKKKDLFDYYFDRIVNKGIFDRTCRKCYSPSNKILLDAIDKYKGGGKNVKVSFSVSGVFLEQCEMFNKDLLESFKQLAETGCVEFLSQTYYHSLASLYPQREEFVEQVEMHRQVMNDLLRYEPRVFENTELLYNNAIARTVEEMGYSAIFTEGVERILHGKSANHIYSPKDCNKVRLLLRNYKLTDDIGFRFSARWWSEWPLTAEKFSSWLAATQGQCVNIFPDYETFGEHHWPETGIHEFLEHLPHEILKWWHLHMSTPSDVVKKFQPVAEIDVPELGGTISWADLERDASCWLGNTMQWAYYTSARRLEPVVKEARDKNLLRIWRCFQTSDHLYYMFTSGGGPGEVHSYFSPFNSPVDAFVTAQSAIFDFENRLRLASLAADEPFLFYKGVGEKNFTGSMAWTLTGFPEILREVRLESVEFHNRRGDFEKWARNSLYDNVLAERLRGVRLLKLQGENLRRSLIEVTKKRAREIKEQRRRAGRS